MRWVWERPPMVNMQHCSAERDQCLAADSKWSVSGKLSPPLDKRGQQANSVKELIQKLDEVHKRWETRNQKILTINGIESNWELATTHDVQNKPIIVLHSQQNCPFFVLLDCGAQRSLITPEAFRKASILWDDIEWKARKMNIFTQLVSATGGRINYQGNYLLDLHAAGRQIPHEFLIV